MVLSYDSVPGSGAVEFLKIPTLIWVLEDKHPKWSHNPLIWCKFPEGEDGVMVLQLQYLFVMENFTGSQIEAPSHQT